MYSRFKVEIFVNLSQTKGSFLKWRGGAIAFNAF